MRTKSVDWCINLVQVLTWLLAAMSPCIATLLNNNGVESAERLLQSASDRSTHPLSATHVVQVVAKAPETLKLGTDDFLGTGLKRKSVAGAYGTTAAVSLGAVAIGYQTLNYRSKNRDAATKAAKDERVREAICSEKRRSADATGPKSMNNDSQSSGPMSIASSSSVPSASEPSRHSSVNVEASQSEAPVIGLGAVRASTAYAYPPSRALSRLDRRARLSDATLNTIEDYNKMIGATEAIASGTIAITSA